MNLLIDIGNSRLKWGIGQGKAIHVGASLPHGKLNFAGQLQQAWSLLDSVPERVALASVAAPELTRQIHQITQTLWPGIEIILAVPQAHACGVQNAYVVPEKLGVDRWLNLLAARQYHRLPACIADCGTALTVDVINAQGVHQGGVIAPGLHLMKQSLQQGTQALEYSTENYPLGLARYTAAAIDSGILYSGIGLIERIMREQPEGTNLLLTGGDAVLLAPRLPYPVTLQTDLVLQGLSVFVEHSL